MVLIHISFLVYETLWIRTHNTVSIIWYINKGIDRDA